MISGLFVLSEYFYFCWDLNSFSRGAVCENAIVWVSLNFSCQKSSIVANAKINITEESIAVNKNTVLSTVEYLCQVLPSVAPPLAWMFWKCSCCCESVWPWNMCLLAFTVYTADETYYALRGICYLHAELKGVAIKRSNWHRFWSSTMNKSFTKTNGKVREMSVSAVNTHTLLRSNQKR